VGNERFVKKNGGRRFVFVNNDYENQENWMRLGTEVCYIDICRQTKSMKIENLKISDL